MFTFVTMQRRDWTSVTFSMIEPGDFHWSQELSLSLMICWRVHLMNASQTAGREWSSLLFLTCWIKQTKVGVNIMHYDVRIMGQICLFSSKFWAKYSLRKEFMQILHFSEVRILFFSYLRTSALPIHSKALLPCESVCMEMSRLKLLSYNKASHFC